MHIFLINLVVHLKYVVSSRTPASNIYFINLFYEINVVLLYTSNSYLNKRVWKIKQNVINSFQSSFNILFLSLDKRFYNFASSSYAAVYKKMLAEYTFLFKIVWWLFL